GEADQTAPDERRPAADRDYAGETRLERPRGQRRGGKRADDETAPDRQVAPNADHEQHPDEERSDERAEEQAETRVRRERARKRGPRAFLEGRVGSTPGRSQQPERGDRRLGREDRAPVE